MSEINLEDKAISIISKYFSKILDEQYIAPLSHQDEYNCFRQIAKGYAMLEIVRSRISKQEKDDIITVINKM